MALFMVVLASVLFGIFPSIQSNVLAHGATPIAMVIVCNSVACLLAGLLCAVQRKSLRVNRKQLLCLLLIGVVGLFTTDYLLDIAYTMIPVGYVTMIHFLYPALVCFAMTLFFRERLTRNRGLAIALSVAGLFLLTGGGFSGSVAGIFVALATAVAYAFYMLATDKTAAAQVDPMVRVFYTNLFVAVTAAVFALRAETCFPDSPALWGQSILIGGMLCTAIYLLNEGIGRIGAGTASFLNMVEPVTSVIVSVVVFRYSISLLSLLGCALILGSLIFAARGSN